MTAADHSHSSAAIVDAIAARLRRERSRQALSATELARRAGLAKSTVTQLEAGQANPSVETLWALAGALGLPFAALLEDARPGMRVVRAAAGVTTRAEQTDYTATLVAAGLDAASHSIYRIALAAGAARHAEPHPPGTEEHLVVTRGRLQAGPARSPVELECGDYLGFAADCAHRYRALNGAAEALLIMAYRDH